MKRNKTASALIVALAMIATTTVFPAPTMAGTENEISARASSALVLDDGMAAVSTNDRLTQIELLYARELWPLSFGQLWAEASWTAGTADSSLFGRQVDTSVFLHSFTVGARYAMPIFSWLIPHLRFGLGVGFGHFELSRGSNAAQAQSFEAGTSTAVGLSGYALGGVEVLIPTASLRRGESSFSVGVVVEGGLSFGTSLSFDVSPDRDEDKLLTPLQGTGLGSLNPTGPVLRVGVVFRF